VDTMARLEIQANAIVSEARPVRVTFEEATAAPDLRKASEREGTLRVITIERLDRSACGGTHVATTAEVGPVLLRRQEKVKQGLRVEFVCGDRALRRARRDLELLTDVARVFSGSLDDVTKLVAGQAAQLGAMQAEHRRLNEALAKYRAAELHSGTSPRADGLRVVVERVASGADSARSLALAFGPLRQALFVAASHDPPSILVATSMDSGLDAGKLLRPVLEEAGGRGGGSARLAQGSAPSPDAIDRVLQRLASLPAAGPA
jgi:alanyl-tRNA synthetase